MDKLIYTAFFAALLANYNSLPHNSPEQQVDAVVAAAEKTAKEIQTRAKPYAEIAATRMNERLNMVKVEVERNHPTRQQPSFNENTDDHIPESDMPQWAKSGSQKYCYHYQVGNIVCYSESRKNQ